MSCKGLVAWILPLLFLSFIFVLSCLYKSVILSTKRILHFYNPRELSHQSTATSQRFFIKFAFHINMIKNSRQIATLGISQQQSSFKSMGGIEQLSIMVTPFENDVWLLTFQRECYHMLSLFIFVILFFWTYMRLVSFCIQRYLLATIF